MRHIGIIPIGLLFVTCKKENRSIFQTFCLKDLNNFIRNLQETDEIANRQ